MKLKTYSILEFEAAYSTNDFLNGSILRTHGIDHRRHYRVYSVINNSD